MKDVKQLHTLSKPGKIGAMTTRNRIVMPPMVTNFADERGFVTEKQIEYYRRRARGGVGYITFEHTSISKQGKLTPRVTMITESAGADRFSRLVDAVHREGCPMVVQINHAGRQTSSTITGEPIVAPSPIPCPVRGEMPKALTEPEIEHLVGQFADAAERAREAGADGVEIQTGHGGLICSFLSAFSNRRTDAYGGSRENRARFAVDVLRAVRKRVGSQYPVICRMSLREYVPGGLELEDTKYYAKRLEESGADALHLSAASSAAIYMNHPSYYVEEGVFVPMAREIKETVSIPVIAVGRIRDARHASQILDTGNADFIAMGRALISDPYLPRKAFDGNFDDIVPCISCNRCIKSIRTGSLACTVNPGVGKEGEPVPPKAAGAKRVMVVGGGPGGMKAAEAAARRGHHVELYEEKSTLGGMVLSGSKPPRKDILMAFVRYLARTLEKNGVTVRCDTVVTPKLVEKIRPDALVIATGSRQALPDIPGIGAMGCHLAEAVYSGSVDLGKHAVVVGGGSTGAELADFISEKEIQVTLLERQNDIAMDLVAHLSHFLKQRLRDKKVCIRTAVEIVAFENRSVMIRGSEGLERITGFDSVVLALGFTPNRSLWERLEETGAEIHLVGDARAPREIIDAVTEGWEAGMAI